MFLNMFSTCCGLGIFMYCTDNSMDNLLSYGGSVDARVGTSEKNLPVPFENLAYQTYCLTPALHTSYHSRRSYGLHANCFEMATFMNFYLVIIRAVLRLHATLNSD